MEHRTPGISSLPKALEYRTGPQPWNRISQLVTDLGGRSLALKTQLL